MNDVFALIGLLVSFAALWFSWNAEQRAKASEEKAEATDAKLENFKKAELQIQEGIALSHKQTNDRNAKYFERTEDLRVKPKVSIEVTKIKNGRAVRLTNTGEATAFKLSIEPFGDEAPNELRHFPIEEFPAVRVTDLTYWLHLQSSDKFGAVVRWQDKEGGCFDDTFDIILG